jgi:hypothetical protein
MKPSARRRVERQVRALMESNGDQCSICKKDLPHNTRIFGGVIAGGSVVQSGECCACKLKETVFTGIYVSRGDCASLNPTRLPVAG